MRSALVATLLVCCLAGGASGSLTFNFQDQGSDLLVTVSGNLDETGLNLNNYITSTSAAWPLMHDPGGDQISIGKGTFRYGAHGGTQHFYPFSSDYFSSSGTSFSGDMVGAWYYDSLGSGNVAVPISYAGGELSGYTLHHNLNISDIGLHTGTWLTFSNGETVEITTIPEPASIALICLVGVGAWFRRRRFLSI